MYRDQIIREIFSAIQRVNELRELDNRLRCSEDTVLFGPNGGCDSLSLVSLILEVEEAINSRFGVQLVLADERAMMERHNPFRDVRSLADYVEGRLQEALSMPDGSVCAVRDVRDRR